MSELVNTWGIFKWSPADGDKHIYREDLSFAKEYLPSFAIFRCIDEFDEYITLKYKSLILRVKPEFYQIVEPPIADIEEKVTVLNGSHAGETGVIENLGWHFNDKKIMYTLRIGKKVSTRLYRDSDIEPINK